MVPLNYRVFVAFSWTSTRRQLFITPPRPPRDLIPPPHPAHHSPPPSLHRPPLTVTSLTTCNKSGTDRDVAGVCPWCVRVQFQPVAVRTVAIITCSPRPGTRSTCNTLTTPKADADNIQRRCGHQKDKSSTLVTFVRESTLFLSATILPDSGLKLT